MFLGPILQIIILSNKVHVACQSDDTCKIKYEFFDANDRKIQTNLIKIGAGIINAYV